MNHFSNSPQARLKLRLRLAALSLNRASLDALTRKYDPSQPRVPAGNADGGQWTDGGSRAGASAKRPQSQPTRATSTSQSDWRQISSERLPGGRERSLHRSTDGFRIYAETAKGASSASAPSRYLVVSPDGDRLSVENRNGVQRIFDGEGNLLAATRWGANGPEPVVEPQLAYDPGRPPVRGGGRTRILLLGISLYNLLAELSSPGNRPAISFNAREYYAPEGAPNKIEFVGMVTDFDAGAACPRMYEVQDKTTELYNQIKRYHTGSAQDLGTQVHTQLHYYVQAFDDDNFVSEYSILKAKAALGDKAEAEYGKLGSLRIDVLEHTKYNEACVYDIKTGNSRLTRKRMAEISNAVARRFGEVRRILVMEIRP